MTFTYSTKDEALANLAAHRVLRETADQRWERSIAVTLAMGASLREVAEVAGVSHSTVRRIAQASRLAVDE